ncbi:hypothetical protein [Nitrospira sp. M1]
MAIAEQGYPIGQGKRVEPDSQLWGGLRSYRPSLSVSRPTHRHRCGWRIGRA